MSSKRIAPVAVDFETYGIESRPAFPPEPVGVAIKWPGRSSRYYAWAHKTGNTDSREDSLEALREAWHNPDGLLFHNARFDIEVAVMRCGMPMPRWDSVHDTELLVFLDNPNARFTGLKPSSAALLGWAPEEQDAVLDWLLEHQPVRGIKVGKSKASKHPAVKYYPWVPPEILGPYACGDVERTEALFALLYPRVTEDERGTRAYDRERRLMPIMLEIERHGLRVDVELLEHDVEVYRRYVTRIDLFFQQRYGCNPGSSRQLVAALSKAGVLDVHLLPKTTTGAPSAARDFIEQAVTDKDILAVLRCRGYMAKCLSTYLEPWAIMARKTAQCEGGRIYSQWFQVRSSRNNGAEAGARTGRLSSSPNFQNFAKKPAIPEVSSELAHLIPDDFPAPRAYIVPDEGCVFVDRDYSQQEPRILAHFEGWALLESYRTNPRQDFHTMARDSLAARGADYPRSVVKGINLGIIYGMGIAKLAALTGLSEEEARQARYAVLGMYPGLREMMESMRRRAKSGKPFWTWGGRKYYCEPPSGNMTFEYKMVNTLIQGSGADCTKEAVVRFYESPERRPDWRVVLLVHDQITVCAPAGEVKAAMECLRSAMESVEFDVKMVTDGRVGTTNWNTWEKYDDKEDK